MITLLPSDVQGVDAPPRWCTLHSKVLCWTGTDTWFVMNRSARRQPARCEVRPWLCKVITTLHRDTSKVFGVCDRVLHIEGALSDN